MNADRILRLTSLAQRQRITAERARAAIDAPRKDGSYRDATKRAAYAAQARIADELADDLEWAIARCREN